MTHKCDRSIKRDTGGKAVSLEIPSKASISQLQTYCNNKLHVIFQKVTFQDKEYVAGQNSLVGNALDFSHAPLSSSPLRWGFKSWWMWEEPGQPCRIHTYTVCTPLLVEKAGVTPDVTFGITACKQESMQARDPLWIWNPWGRTHKVQNRSNQWLHKMGLGPTKNLKKKKKKKIKNM